MKPGDKPDAVLAPRKMVPGGRPPHRFFNARYGPLWGLQSVPVHAQGDMYFIHKGGDASLHFPTMHPLSPAEMHDWYVVQTDANGPMLALPIKVNSWHDKPDCVKYGYLKDVDDVDQPGLDEKAAWLGGVRQIQIDYKNKVDRYAELVNLKDGMDAAQTEEFEAIKQWFTDLAVNGPPDPLKVVVAK